MTKINDVVSSSHFPADKISGIQGANFEIGFWHPFGPHGEETAEGIIARKRKEIQANDWTLWSFQYRTKDTLESWFKKIAAEAPNNVLVFCSGGVGARAPAGQTKYCEYYVPIGALKSETIPSGISVPHPMGGKIQKGSAFIVKNIIYPASYEEIPIEWLKDGKWQTRVLPTRPEYLIKPGRGQPMRKFRAILELKYPYLAEVGILPLL